VTTELAFLRDAYLREADATVTAVDGDRVALDRTILYPTGGGQAPGVVRLPTPGGIEDRAVERHPVAVDRSHSCVSFPQVRIAQKSEFRGHSLQSRVIEAPPVPGV